MTKRIFRVFVASPGNVPLERDALAILIAGLNQTIAAVAPEKDISLELVRWETHSFPAVGRPQGVINEQIGEFDVFVGILWTHFGTPTGVAGSGTEEEFNLAYKAWEQHGRPHIMFYFCQAASPPPASSTEAEQLLRVVKFRQQLSEKALVWEYRSHSDFADTVRPHILQVLKKAIAVEKPCSESKPLPTSDLAFAQAQLRRLSVEYARIRADMPSGYSRTRQMEIIVTHMRTVALSAVPILPKLAESSAPGERLAAIAILQVVPQANYVEWLGDQCLEVQPFVAYHAAVALLTSVRMLDCLNRFTLESAIQKGLYHLGAKQDTDRYSVLSSAVRELKARCSM